MEHPPEEIAPSAAVRRLGTWVRGKYQLDSILGEGGMAVVYAATHRNKKRFAVKMLRGDLTSAEAMRRFLREGYVANTVDHPGAVAVIDDDVAEDGSAFLVMDLLEGESVEQLWETAHGKLAPKLVLAIAHQLTDVLAAAHLKDVVHRDVKPANIFMTRDGRVMVLDFGIARLREASETASATRTGVTMGTPAFMPPEQARGKSSLISPATDVWAVGATMFTLLSGVHVHDGESPQEIVMNAATSPARSLASVAPSVPAVIAKIVDRALSFGPEERWPSASAMRDAIADAHRELYGELPLLATSASATRGAPSEPSVTVPASVPDLLATAAAATHAATLAMDAPLSAAGVAAQPASTLPLETSLAPSSQEKLPRATPTPMPAGGRPSPMRFVVLGVLALAMFVGVVWSLRSRGGDAKATVLATATATTAATATNPTVTTPAASAPAASVLTASDPAPPITSALPVDSARPTPKAGGRPGVGVGRPKPNTKPSDWDHQ